MNDSYILDFLGTLHQSRSKKQINSDIKSLEKKINMLRLTATFAKADTKRELNTYIKQLSDQLSTIKLKAQIDSKKLKSEVNKALNNVSFKDIDALNIDENKTKLKVQKIVADTKTYIEKNPISIGVNIDSKKNKLDNDLTAYLNKYTKITESSVLLEEANKVRDLIGAITDKKSLTEATDAFRLFKSEVSATGFASKSTVDKIKSMLGHITKIGSAFGVASIAVNNFVKSLKTLRSNDTILTEISKTSEMTKQQLKELGDEAFKVASKFGQLSSNYLLAVQEMARSGYEETSKELGELSLLAQSAGDMTADNANNYLLATDAAYKYSGSVEKLNAALDGANYISNRNSASLTDIADATRVSASFAANAGVAIDELTAAEATMIATTKRSGSEIGRAFRSIVLNLQQVSGEFDGEVIDEEQLKKVEERCHSLGVELEYMKDGIATLRNPIEVLKDLSEVYNSLPDNSADKQGLISDLGGKYHANALSALLSQWDMYEKMLSEFSQGAGSALEEAEKTANSLEGCLATLQNSWDSFINTLTNKDAVMSGVSFFDRLIQGAEKLTDTIGEIPVVLTTLHTAMTALKSDYGITQLVNPETNKLDIQGNMLGIDFSAIKEQKKHFEEAEEAIAIWNSKLKIGKGDLETFNYAVVQNNAQLKDYLSTCTKDAPASLSGYKAHLNAAGISTDALRFKTILLNSAISMGIGVAIQAAVQGITYLIQREENLRQATEEAANAYKESASSIDDYASKYQELREALIKAKGNEEETYNIKKQLLELQTELNDKFGDEKGVIDLVTEAYKDQTEAIRALNKEKAQTFLNENKEGIDQATREMTKDRHYNLSYTGMIATTEKGALLKEIAEKYADQGVSILDEGDGGVTFSVHLNADAQSAYDTINAFETDLRNKAIELGDEHMFDDVLDISSDSLNKAKDTIDDFKDTYKQALVAEIVVDDSKARTYSEALEAVEAYNDAVLRSEDPYNDQNVTKAKEKLDAIKGSIQGNEEEWGKYSILFDDVFDQADTRLIEFNEAMKTDDGLKELANDLEGLSDVDLKSLDENVGKNESFDKLKESADEYHVSVGELIDSLVRLGYVQGEIQSTVSDTEESIPATISSSIQQIATQLEPQFTKLGEAYKEIFKLDDNGKEKFSLDGIDNSMLEELRQAFAEIKEEVGVTFDASKLESFFDTLTNGESTSRQVKDAFNELATAYLYSTDTLEQLNSETANGIVMQLEAMGVENAAEIVADELKAKTEELIVAKEYLAQTGKDLASATEEERTAFILEQIEAGNCGEALALLQLKKMLVNGTLLDTSADINNVLALAQAAGIATDALTRLQSLKASFDNAQASGNYGAMNAISAEMSKVKTQIETDIANFKPVEIQFDSTSAAKSAKKAGSSAGGAYVKAFQDELQKWKDLEGQGKISHKQYLDALLRLVKKYFGDRQKYAEEYAQYMNEYLKGYLDLYNSTLSGISTLLNRKISAANEARDATISALQEEKEAAAEAYQSQIDAIEKEKDAIGDLIKEKNKKIDSINKEIDAIERATETRKKNINLQQQEYNLEHLLNQRTILQYSKERGLHYVVDQNAINSAREKVKEAQEELKIDRLKTEADLIQKEIDLLEEKKDSLSEEQEVIQKLMDESNKYYSKLISEQEKYFDSMIKNMEQQKSKWEELAEIQEIAEAYSAIEQVFGELGYSVEDILNGSESAFEDFKSRYIAIMSDMNQNTSFQEGLEYASGVAKENFGSIVSDAHEAAQELSNTFSDGTFSQAITQGVSDGIVSAKQELDKMDQLGRDAGDGLINGWDERIGSFIEIVRQAAMDAVEAFAEGQDSHSPSEAYKSKASDAIDGLLLGIEENKQSFIDAVKELAEDGVLAFEEGFNFENSTLNSSFDGLKLLIESVTEALGIGTGGSVGGLLGALDQLSKFTFSEDSIVKQFNNLKEAIDSVTSAISGGGESSGGEGQGSSGSSKGNESGGKGSESGNGNSLTGAITEMSNTANEIIGEPDAEGDGTVIGEFGSMKTAVNDVTTAIGGGDSENGESSGSGDEGNLIESITDLGTTTEETLGESGGDGVIGRFEEFKDVIGEANEHVHGISDGLAAIDGQEVECTIKVNIETTGGLPAFAEGTLGNMNLESGEYTAKYGKAFAEGTGKYKGLPHDEKNALVSEYGQTEMTVLPNGNTIITDEPTMMDLPKGTVIYNEDQTKQIMDNKIDAKVVKSYANGVIKYSDGTIIRPDGSVIEPYDPDKDTSGFAKLYKAWHGYYDNIDKNVDEINRNLSHHLVMEHSQKMNAEVNRFINNSSSVVNNTKNQPVTVNQNVTVNCPNVTNNSGVENIQKELSTLSLKALQVNW